MHHYSCASGGSSFNRNITAHPHQPPDDGDIEHLKLGNPVELRSNKGRKWDVQSRLMVHHNDILLAMIDMLHSLRFY